MTTEAAGSLVMECRGGHHCCQREAPCSEGGGDCREDRDCDTGLECGAQGNCVDMFGLTLGLWGPEDRCCQRPCTPDRPCSVGQVRHNTSLHQYHCNDCQGPCTGDDECAGLTTCSARCDNSMVFPATLGDTWSRAWSPEHMCCVATCHPGNTCGHGDIGCIKDTDCKTGTWNS